MLGKVWIKKNNRAEKGQNITLFSLSFCPFLVENKDKELLQMRGENRARNGSKCT